MSREAKRQRLALVEVDELVGQALRDLEQMKVGLECIQGEVRDALNPPSERGGSATVVAIRRAAP